MSDQHHTPPKLPLKFLRWFCREDFIDEIEGNLVEIFEKENETNSTNARWQFILNVARHFRPEYLKIFHSRKKSSSFLPAMIINYLKLAFRNLRKRASYSFINIVGLALGVCAALLILNYMDFETSYDSFHANADRLYRIKRTFTKGTEEPGAPNVFTTHGLGPTIANEIPLVERYIRTHPGGSVVTYHPSNGTSIGFHEDNLLFVDSTFFKAFTFEPLAGDLPTVLDNPNNIVLTESMWHKYFGYNDAIGKTIELAGGRVNGLYTVAAIIKDVPDNSHFSFDFVVPIHNLLLTDQYQRDDGWAWNNFSTYVELHKATEFASAEERLSDLAIRWIDPKWKNINGHTRLNLQPLLNIHNEPGIRHDVETIGRSTIYFFGLIAVFILFIAWINYVNLSTARAMERSREVGIKKTIGAARSELVTQFLLESIVINVIAIVLAVGFATLLLPVLSGMIGKQLPSHFGDLRFWGVLASLFVIGTLASGIYPAFVMSAFRITKAIGKTNEKGFTLRKGLVVFQFVSSLVLITGTFVVYQQIRFMQSRDTGLQLDQMLIIEAPGTLKWQDNRNRMRIFKEEAKKLQGVESIATSGAIPSGGYNWGADIRKVGEPESSMTLGCVVFVDPDFIPTYNIDLIAGHNYNLNSATDMKSVVINEASLEAFKLGTAEEALTQRLVIDDTFNIVGVAKNYNWNSLKSEFTPFVLMPDTIMPGKISVHLKGGSIPATIDELDKLYRQLAPADPFEYKFLDDTFNLQYKSDQQFGRIFGMFAGLAIAICCLGLWGLASFTTSQKLKEIGIRKVLGASVRSIAYLLVRQFMILIGLSAMIAIPLSWYGMDSWLNGFAFKIGIGWVLFAIPIMILTGIALLTIGLQVRRGAVMNPVDVLRSE
ncbi:MAG: ABC transporter permease [Bacteroidota bacterium]